MLVEKKNIMKGVLFIDYSLEVDLLSMTAWIGPESDFLDGLVALIFLHRLYDF